MEKGEKGGVVVRELVEKLWKSSLHRKVCNDDQGRGGVRFIIVGGLLDDGGGRKN